MEDRLIIGIDISKERDKSCMTIARRNGRGYVVVNQLYNKEAENVYNILISRKTNLEVTEIMKEKIKNGFGTIKSIYSQKDILEIIDLTRRLKNYNESIRNDILNYHTPRKLQEILAAFWLTHTNDEFFIYFGFNWVPTIEIQEEARKKLDNQLVVNIPLVKADIDTNYTTDILKNIENQLNISNAINPKLFLRGATEE